MKTKIKAALKKLTSMFLIVALLISCCGPLPVMAQNSKGFSDPFGQEPAQNGGIDPGSKLDPKDFEPGPQNSPPSLPSDFNYTISAGNTATVTGYLGDGGDVVIPANFEGYPVTTIAAGAFGNQHYITSITFPASLTSIANGSVSNGAFYNCSNLAKVTFLDSAASIGNYAFYNCARLKEIEFGDNIVSIGNNSFQGCTDLEAVTLAGAASIGNSTFYGCTGLETVILLGVNSIGYQAFYNCTALENISFGETLQTIGYHAFYSCRSLAELTFPASLTAIQENSTNGAFRGCSGLKKVTFADSAATIGGYTFYGCNQLEEVDFGHALKSIGNYAFSNCTALTQIALPESVTAIGTYGFNGCSALQYVYIPNEDTTFTVYTFGSCPSLKAIIMGDGLTDESGVLYDKTGTVLVKYPSGIELESYTIKAGVTTIRENAFESAKNLQSLTLPESLKTIEISAFSGCSALLAITFPAGFTSIAGGNTSTGAFIGCSNLAKVTFADSAAAIGNYAFYNCSRLEEVEFGGNIVSIGNNAFQGCTRLETLTLSGSASIGNSTFYGCTGLKALALTGAIAIGNSAFYNCTGLKTVALAGVQSIEYQAFYNCTAMEDISFGEDLKTIGYYAFNNCRLLTELNFPASLTAIQENGSYDYGAFRGCIGLTKITFANSAATIGRAAFYGCTKLVEVDFGDAIKSIGSSAFYTCTALPEITVPASVTAIGASGFYGCTNLELVYILNEDTTFTSNTFGNCPNLKSIIIGDGQVDDYGVLYDKTGAILLKYPSGLELESYTIPEGVTAIRDNAFENAKNLKSLILPQTLETIGVSAFINCSALLSITFPASLTSIAGGTTTTGAFIGCSNLTKATFLGSAAVIGNYSFYNCSKLEEIEFGANIVSVGAYAFSGCSGLKDLTLTGAPSIGNYAFQGCTGLKSVLLTGAISIGNNAFYNCTKLETVTLSGAQTIGNYAFYSCTSLLTATLTGVTTIGAYGFSNCTALEEISFGEALQTIGYYAFYNCCLLTELTFPASLTAIQDYNSYDYGAFRGCTGLTKVSFAGSAASIGRAAFYGCSQLAEIDFGAVKSIGINAFYNCTSLIEITIPANTTSIGAAGFYGCSNLQLVYIISEDTTFAADAFGNCPNLKAIIIGEGLVDDYGVLYDKTGTILVKYPSGLELETYTIPAGVTAIRDNAFENAKNLRSLTLPATLKTIGVAAFNGCSNLLAITFPAALTSIAGGNTTTGAFYGCNNLTGVTFLGSAATIGNYAFYNCSKLAEVDFGDNLVSIGNYAFNGCNELKQVALTDITSIGSNAFQGCSKLETVELAKIGSIGSNAFRDCPKIETAALTDLAATGTYLFYGCTGLKEVSLNEVRAIGAYAFYNCTSLEDISFGEALQTIGYYAFSNCRSLTELIFPASLTAIQDYGSGYSYGAFRDCTGLRKVSFENSAATIGGYAFYGCTQLADLNLGNAIKSIGFYAFYNCTALSQITLPATVTGIGIYAFYNCRPVTMVIPSFVSSIGNNAFQNCNTLISSYFYGHAPLTFGSNVFGGTAAGFTIYYLPVRVGWSTPLWNGYPTATFSAIFSLTLEAGSGGNIIRGSGGAYQVGQEIGLTAAPDKGYRFSHWECSGFGEFDNEQSAEAVFTMPAEDVTVRAVFEVIPPDANWQDEGNYDTGWYNTSLTTFTLTSPEQLAGLARLVNNGNNFSGKTVRIGGDIVLSPHYWTPIGASGSPFAGNFDGQEYKIIGLNIDAVQNNQGLFGFNTGTVRNSGITIGEIKGGSATAAIAGFNTGLVQNCYNLASVNGIAMAGGIAGENSGLIENCFNSGNISASGNAGGIAGSNLNTGIIQNCYNAGNLDSADAGGIVAFNSGELDGCYWLKNGEVNAGLTYAAALSTGSLLSLGSFAAPGATLQASDDTDLMYGTALLGALNFWVWDTRPDNPSLLYWAFRPGENKGLPVLTLDIPITEKDVEPPRINSLTPAHGARIGKTVNLSIRAADNVALAKIELYVSANGVTWQLHAQTATTNTSSFTWNYPFDTGAFPNGALYVKILAYDTSGNISDGTFIRGYIIDNALPDPPSGFTVVSGSAYIYLSWDPVYSGGFDKFILYRAVVTDGEPGPFSKIYETKNYLGYYDKSIEHDKTYAYYLTAMSSTGYESEASPILRATPLPDTGKPLVYSVYPKDGASLKSSAAISASLLDDYRLARVELFCRPAATLTWTLLEQKPLTLASEIAYFNNWSLGLAEGDYDFKFVATDAAGNASDDYIVRYSIDNTPPAERTLTAIDQDLAAGVSWNKGAEEADIAGYKVYRANTENGIYSYVANIPATTLQYVSRNLDPGDYWFKVVTYDTAGNESNGVTIMATANKNDFEPPVVVIRAQNEGLVNFPISFSGLESTDNDRIASFIWDFNDGSTSTLPMLNHTFSSEGTYTVSLTAKDRQGNTTTETLEVVVYGEEERIGVEILIRGRNADGSYSSLRDALVFVREEDESITEPEDESETFSLVTDTQGKAYIVAKPGVSLNIAAVKDSYDVTSASCDTKDASESILQTSITMNRSDWLVGVLSAKRMTLEEIMDAGIDIRDPDNQFVWEFTVEITLEGRTFREPVLINDKGIMLNGSAGGFFLGGSGGGTSIGGGGGGGGGVWGYGIEKGGQNAAPALVFLYIYGDVHWLKEFFKVELELVNYAPEGCDIIDLQAKLNLPENGLSLAPTLTPQSLVADLDSISGNGGKASAGWVVRGDAQGEYLISADVSGRWSDNNESITKTFLVENPIKVWAGSAMEMNVTADSTAKKGEIYNVDFELVNVSDIDLYNVTLNIDGGILSPVYLLNGIENPPGVLVGGTKVGIETFSPGDKLTARFSIVFDADYIRDDLIYVLKSLFVFTRSGSNTVVPVNVGFRPEKPLALTGIIRSYIPNNPAIPTVIELMRDGIAVYQTTTEAEDGQTDQSFTFTDAAPGRYDLVISKAAHTKFIIRNVLIDGNGLDLTQDSRPEVQLIILRCGDINGDGLINDADLTVLWRAGNYNRKASEAENPLCDLNGDGLINDADLTILWQAYNYNRGPIIIE